MSNFTVNPNLSLETIFVGKEKEKILVIDNFLSSYQELITIANSQDFSPYNTLYPGIKSLAPTQYSNAMFEVIIPIISANYSLVTKHTIQKAKCLFSLITSSEGTLSLYQCAPHRDSSYEYQFAILLYLCDETHGGTSFYRHNMTGFETVTLPRNDFYNKAYDEDIILNGEPRNTYQIDSDRRYTKIGEVQAKLNRLVIYRSCLLHSPNINLTKSVSSDPLSGRLTLNSFVAFT